MTFYVVGKSPVHAASLPAGRTEERSEGFDVPRMHSRWYAVIVSVGASDLGCPV